MGCNEKRKNNRLKKKNVDGESCLKTRPEAFKLESYLLKVHMLLLDKHVYTFLSMKHSTKPRVKLCCA